MFCVKCGKEIGDEASFCPDCGSSQQRTVPHYSYDTEADFNHMKAGNTPYNSMCIAGFIVSCVSILINFFGIVGIVGTVLSAVGLVDCQKKNENGKVLAIIGIAVGIVSIVFGLFVIMVILF